MKLLFVIGDISGSGGTERVTIEIASALALEGYDVSILSLFGPAEPWFEVPTTISLFSAGLSPVRGNLYRALTVMRCLWSNANTSCASVVILVDTILFAFCIPWVRRVSFKIVCWEHFNLGTSHGSLVRGWARWAASRWSDCIVVLTKRDANSWQNRYKLIARVQSIANPVTSFPEQSLVSCATLQGSPVVLAVGRLTFEKGFDLLLRAWAQLASLRGNWNLRIVGDGKEKARLCELAEELNVRDSVFFVGQVKNVSLEYRKASIYVLSSRWEGLPMSLLEAQHFGLPSLAFDCPTGPREVLVGGGGLLVPPGDIHGLAASLVRMMTNPDLRVQLSHAAVENSRRFSRESVIRDWELLLSALTS